MEQTYQSVISLISKETSLSNEQVDEMFINLGIDPDSETAIQDMSDDELLPFGDFRRELQEKLGVPLIKVRKAYRILHAKKDKKEQIDNNEIDEIAKLLHVNTDQVLMLLAGGKNIGDFVDVKKLLHLYDPSKTNSIICKILKARFGNKSIIAFDPETSKVAVNETVSEIECREQGFTPSEYVTVGNTPVELYPVGVNPNSFFNENPVFIGQPLKGSNEQCTVTGRSWLFGDDTLRIKQFARIAVEMGEIKPESEAVHNFLDKLGYNVSSGKIPAGWDYLTKRYPKVAIEFERRRKINNLPSLKIYLSNGKFQTKDNPFS